MTTTRRGGRSPVPPAAPQGSATYGSWLWSQVAAHARLLATGVVLFTVVAKLIAVSHGHTSTIAALIATQGLTDLALSALLIGLPSAMWVAAVLAAGGLAQAIRDQAAVSDKMILVGLVFAAIAAATPFIRSVVFLVLIVTTVIPSLLWALTKRARAKRRVGDARPASSPTPLVKRLQLTGSLVIFMSWFPLLGDKPWMPPEQIESANAPDRPLVAYVLASDDNWITVMGARDRQVATLKAARVVSRAVCSVGRQRDERPLLFLLWRVENAGYPRCTGEMSLTPGL
ncbi:MAG TPA: hypothetical protein VNB24_09015 [Acidimicrobiales bacterium]|nr:hypothetical protein [Acidimicrobiales bacterium]